MARLVFISVMLLFAIVNAQLDCKNSCKSFKKTRVCASNGISFKTPCLMQKYACARGITLTVVSEGRCPDGVAQPRARREQNSSEEEDAPAKFGGGSSSEEGSNSGSSEEHKAPFTTGLPGPIATTTLAPVPLDTNQPMTPEGSGDYVTEFEIDATTSTSDCMMNCPLVTDPVCGTDGVTYPSRCVLEVEACRARGDTNTVTVAYPGPCIQATLSQGAP